MGQTVDRASRELTPRISKSTVRPGVGPRDGLDPNDSPQSSLLGCTLPPNCFGAVCPSPPASSQQFPGQALLRGFQDLRARAFEPSRIRHAARHPNFEVTAHLTWTCWVTPRWWTVRLSPQEGVSGLNR